MDADVVAMQPNADKIQIIKKPTFQNLEPVSETLMLPRSQVTDGPSVWLQTSEIDR